MIRVNLAERQRHLSKRQHHAEPVYGHPMASTSSRTESEEAPQVVKEIPYKVVKMDDPRLVMKKKVLLRELESRQSSHVITEDNMRQHDRTETPTSHKERLQAYFKTLTRDEPPQPRSLGPKLSLTGGAINLLFTERDEKNTPDLIKIYPVSTNERPYYFSGIHHTFTPTNKTVKFEVDGREFSSVEGYVKSMMALELRGDVIQVEDMAFRRYFQDKGISQRQLDTWLTDRGFLFYQKALVHRLKSDPEMLKKLVETEKKVIIYTFRLDELLGSGVEYKCIDKYWEDLATLRVCIRYPTRFPVKPEDFWIVPRLIKGYNLLGCFLMAIRHQLQTGEKIEDLDFEMLEYSTNYTENIVHKRFYEEEIPTKRSRMSMRTSEYSFKTPESQCNEFRPQTPNTIFGELHLQSVSGSVQGSPTRSECNSVSTSMSDYNIEPTFKAPLPRFSTNSPNLTTPNKLSNSFTQYRNKSFFGSSTSLSTLCSIRLNTSAHSSREDSIQNGSNGANSETTPTFGANENRKVHDQQHFESQESSKVSTFDLSKMCSPNMERSRILEGTIKSFHFQPFVAKIPRKNVENEENAMDSEDTLTPPTRSENSSRNPSGNSVNQQNVCGIGEKIDQNGCHGPHGEDKIGNIGQNRGSDVVVKAGKDQIRHENRIQGLGQAPGTSEIQQVQNGQQRLHGEDRNGRSGNIRPSEWGNQVRNEIFERAGHLQQVGNVQVQPVDRLPQVEQGQRKVSRNGCNDGQDQIKLPENTYQEERGGLRQEIHGHQAQQVQNRQNFVQNVENCQSQSEILLHQDARTRSGPQRHLEQLDGPQNQRKIHIIHDGEDSESDDELSETMETCSNPSIEVEMDYSRRMEERNHRRRDVVSPARSNKHFTPRKLPGQRVEMEENVVPSSSTVPTRNVDVSAKKDVNSTTKCLWNQENPPKLSAEPILIDEKNLEAPEIPQKSDADTKKASNPQGKANKTNELDSLYPKNVQIEPLAQSIDDSDFANAFSSSDMDVRPKNEAEPTPGTSQAAPCVREIEPSLSDDGIFQFVRAALQGQEIQIEVRNPQGMNELEAGKGEATDLADDNESVMSEGTKLIARKAKIMDDCFEDLNLRFGIITADLDDAILLQDDSEGYDTMDQEEEEAFFRSIEEAQNKERSSQQ